MNKKIVSLLLSMTMTASMAVPALADEEKPMLISPAPATVQVKGDDEVRILYTNDVHTYIDNTIKNDAGEKEPGLRYSQVAGYKKAVNADFLVDAGDHIQGTVYGTYDKGETIIKLMEATGYTCSTLGNHEFDYDMPRTKALIEMADYDYVSCNIVNTDTGEQLLDSYKVYTAENGKKVAFIGFTTPEAYTKSTPKYFMNEDGKIVWSFSQQDNGAALYKAAQAAIDAASKEADYVIGVGHMGIDGGSAPFTSEDIIHNTSGLTAFIDGHSHTKVPMQEVKDKDGKTIILTQTECYLHYLGEMSIDKDGNVTTHLITPSELRDMGIEHDAEVKAIEDAYISKVDNELSKVIGATEVPMTTNNEWGRMVRNQETTLANFCTDATYYYFDNRGYDIDVALMNGGGIRTDLDGEITAKILQKLYPWGNVLCLVDMTGQQLLDGLEFGSKNATVSAHDENGALGEGGGFLTASGLKYRIDVTLPNTTVADEQGVWQSGPADGVYRVHDVMVKNRQTGEYEPLDLNKHYTVGGINYTLRELGDGFAMFTGANIVDGVAVDYMAPLEYIQSFPKDAATGLPTIKAGMGYDATEGRVILEGSLTDVAPTAWYRPAATEAINAKLMKGTDKGFEGLAEVTRATVLQTLYNMDGATTKGEGSNWYADALAWAGELGLVDANTFEEKVIDRQEILNLLKTYAEKKGFSADGLMIGNENGDMMLDKTLTRSEFAQILVRLNAKKSA